MTTNKYTEYASQQKLGISSSSINSGDDEVRSSPTTTLSPQKKKTRPNKPCNYDFAKEVVRDWYRSNDWDPDEKGSSASIEALNGRRINNFRNYLFTAIENEIYYEDDEE